MPNNTEALRGLLDYVRTMRQKEVLEAIIKHGNNVRAAKALGLTRSTVQHSVRAVKRHAARRGYSPEHDYHHGQPEGFLAKGVSTLYGEDGEKKLQWVKSSIDHEKQRELIEAGLKQMASELPKLPPIKRTPGALNKELLNLYPVTDAHLGMMSWGKESGVDWDLKKGVEYVERAFMMALECSPPAHTAVVAQLGDFLHSDSLKALTPEGKNVLDQDSRFSKIVGAAVRLLRRMVEAALAKHERVHLIISEGNHDPVSSIFLRVMFQERYEDQPRLIVNDEESPYCVVEHGKTMLGFHHGHLKGIDGKSGSDLALIFADGEAWARTKWRYIHTGHLHSEKKLEVTGAQLHQHTTIAARDAYAARGGWKSQRAMRPLYYHSEYGDVGGSRVTPEMLEVGS